MRPISRPALNSGRDACAEEARRLERVMRSRSVQILYHLYEVALNKDQGIVGSVLTDYYMEEQHTEDLAEARLREAAKEGEEMTGGRGRSLLSSSDPLLAAALDYARESLLSSCLAPARVVPVCTRQCLQRCNPRRTSSIADWRVKALQVLQSMLSEHHRALRAAAFPKVG